MLNIYGMSRTLRNTVMNSAAMYVGVLQLTAGITVRACVYVNLVQFYDHFHVWRFQVLTR
jgi:hypothetical protein